MHTSLRALPLVAFLSTAPVVAQGGFATYEVVFDATWSAATHPAVFPPNPHFSPLIGGTHNSSVDFWQVGGISTLGMERMAELGSTTNLRSEVQAAINAGTAEQVLQFGGIALSPNSRTVRFTVSAEYPEVTLVSMLAPSPDWFVGVGGMSMLQNGQWTDSLVVPLELWDAGTDNGVTYLSANANTSPKQPISGISTSVGPFQSQSTVVGTFTFNRVASSLVYGCGVNPAGSMAVTSEAPTIGNDTILEIHDPVGTLNQPANILLALSALPSAAFPCGVTVPFAGLSAIGAPGELLLRPQIATVGLPAWNGSPVPFTITIPNEPLLVDQRVFMQGVMFDAVAPRVGLTDALELYIGS